MSQPGYQTIEIHILPNISRSKSNQTVKFSQLKKYFSSKITQEMMKKWGKKTSSRPLFFLKKKKIYTR